MGNQYVKTLGLAKAGKILGIAGAAVGVGLILGVYSFTIPIQMLKEQFLQVSLERMP